MFLIASYPRSGNHLVRFCIEYVTGKPTLGHYRNPKDLPIHLNGFVDNPGILSHVGGEPIGHKLHYIAELERIREKYQIDGIVFIKRNMMEAILAHTNKNKKGRKVRDLKRHISKYIELENYYTDSGLPKVCINYDSLVSQDADSYQSELDKLLQFLGPQVVSQHSEKLRSDFAALRQVNANPTKRAWLGKRSQGSDYWRKNTAWHRCLLVKSLIWWKRHQLITQQMK
ncbi:MAG: hypothetical protein AAF362_00490 [Pseudomonadota bacterium]